MRMQRQKGLTRQSLIAASTAAYAGSWVLFAINLVWRIHTGADARICPLGSQDFSDWCTIGETLAAFLLVFLWALYALPFALAVTIVPALALARLSPRLERRNNDPKLGLAQYALAATVGVFVMLLLSVATGEDSVVISATVGFVGALAGVWAFRRTRYPKQKSSN